MTSTRAFIAVHMPAELGTALVALCAELEAGPGGHAARWVTGDNIHLTLKFLGDVDDRRLPEVYRAVSSVCADCAPIEATVAGLGCFPNDAQPRIIWAGITRGARELVALAGALDLALGQLGFPTESRPYSAHVTLARANSRAAPLDLAALRRAIADRRAREIGTMTVNAVSIVKSELRPAGPLYTDISVAALGATDRRHEQRAGADPASEF